MSAFLVSLDAFHFIRPLVLLLIPVAIVIWWLTRRSAYSRDILADGLAPHLRKALILGSDERRRIQPIDMVAVALILLVIGAAGPTWSRTPDPFVAQSAPVVVALKVTPSMEENDIAPSRLERGKQKIRDLLKLRAGARTALVAYAGSAHLVVPMTEDPSVMTPYLEGLEPQIMPQEGERAGLALQLGLDMLANEETPGGVLFVADSLDPADAAAINDAGQPVVFLAMLREDRRDRGFDQLAVPVVNVTPDAADIGRLDRLLNAAYRQALLENTDQPWEDRGYWLAWPVALLILFWFRQGWTMRWAVIAVVAMPGLFHSAPARADGIADWFMTPDQQGRIAFQNRNFNRAAELFADPLWRGYAQYRDGQYEEAVVTLDRFDTAEAAFIQGMAHIKSRSYRDGLRAFETVLQRDPDYPHAEENLETAREIVDYVERVREQSDTGESGGIGADEVVFDNEANRGVETDMEAPSEDGVGLITADQWMNTVDTRTGDFLRQRFAVEAAKAGAPEASQ